MHRKKIMLAFAATLPLAAICGETFVWTGAADNYWTNALNWSVGGQTASRCPGAVESATKWTDWAVETDSASFTAVGAVRTTIDLDGLFSISNIVVSGADAPVYTFGTGDQILPMRVYGVFTVASDVVNMPVLPSNVSYGVGITTDSNQSLTICNEATGELVVHNLVHGAAHPNLTRNWGEGYLYFKGAGPLRITGKRLSENPVTHETVTLIQQAEFRMNKIVFLDDFGELKRIQFFAESDIELGPNAIVTAGGYNYSATFHKSNRIHGRGVFRLNSKGQMISNTGMTTTFECDFQSVNDSARDCLCVSSGNYAMKGVKSVALPFYLAAANTSLAADSLGVKGTSGALGDLDVPVRLGNGSSFRYIGAGEISERGIVLTNLSAQTTATIRHDGTGDWENRGAISLVAPSGVLTLAGTSANTATLTTGLTDGLLNETPAPLSLVKEGSATWRLGGANTYSGSTVVREGTLSLKDFTSSNGTIWIGSNDTTRTSKLVLDGGSVAAGLDPVWVGYGEKSWSISNVKGSLALTNVTWVSPAATNTTADAWYGDGAIMVGYGGSGEIAFDAGCVVTTKLVVAAAGDKDHFYQGESCGLAIQRGGDVHVLGAGNNEWHLTSCIGTGANSAGAYEMQGGKLSLHGSFSVGGYGVGVFHQLGGDVTVTNHPARPTIANVLRVGSANGGEGALYVGGGTLISRSGLVMTRSSSAGSYGTLVVDGPDAFVDLGDGYLGANSAAGAVSTITLRNGGTLRTDGIAEESKDETSHVTVNFDGGVFKTGRHYRDIFAIGINRPDAVYVYGRGATIDTEGLEGGRSSEPFRGASGKGVSRIPWTTRAAETIPFVKIEGDGLGASAIALYDSAAHSVTGILVTAAGCNYNSATATIVLGPRTEKVTVECELADNANTGSFTKVGAGGFTLLATNTWGGATIVKGGTLKAGCDWAVPEDSAVVLAGGNLDFGGFTGVVSKVTYGAGGGQILNATNVQKPAADDFDLAISTDELASNQSIALTGDVDLAGKTLALTGDLTTLDSNTRYTVLQTTGALSGLPVVSPSLATGWTLRRIGSALCLSLKKGILIITR